MWIISSPSLYRWWKKTLKRWFKSNRALPRDLWAVRVMDYMTKMSKWRWRQRNGESDGANPILSYLQTVKCGLCSMTTISVTSILWRWGEKEDYMTYMYNLMIMEEKRQKQGFAVCVCIHAGYMLSPNWQKTSNTLDTHLWGNTAW